MNSAGMRYLKNWKTILRTGHSLVFMSLQLRGDNTRVSHAATVRVHTKKYLCALRWGGRFRYGGKRAPISNPDIFGDYSCFSFCAEG